MNSTNQYNDFTEKHYKYLLKTCKRRYSFITYKQIKSYHDSQEFLLWRHDVDFSMHRSLSLAKIESDLGIKATYFFLLGSEHYNIFENEIQNIIKKIISKGHSIGLHFDPTLYKITSKKDLKKKLKFEKNILEKIFKVSIQSFSFHNPTDDILRYDAWKYENMINTYASYFKENVAYCSDSNGYWRHERLEKFLNRKVKINKQVLTHPVWWQKKAMSPFNRVKRTIYGRMQKRIQMYKKNLKIYGRINVK